MRVPVEMEVPAVVAFPLQQGIVAQDDLAAVAIDERTHDVDAGPGQLLADLVAVVLAPDQVDGPVQLPEDFLRSIEGDILAGKVP